MIKCEKQNITVYLHVVSVDHNLDDSIPDLLRIQVKDQRSDCMRTTHLLTDVIAGKSDQIENDVNVPDVKGLFSHTFKTYADQTYHL